MNPISAFGGQFAGGLAIDSSGGWMDAADKRTGLMNSVTGNESPEQLVALNQQDKGLALKQAQDGTNYQIANAMQEANERRRQKDREHHQSLFSMGAIFA